MEYNLCFDGYGAGVVWGGVCVCGNDESDQVWTAKVNQMLW